MEEETRILNRIFDNEGNWIAPFDRTDLEDVFNLARLTAFMKKTSAEEIIRLLQDAGLDGLPENPDDAEQKGAKTADENADENDLSFFDDPDFGFGDEEPVKKKISSANNAVGNGSDEDLKKEVKDLIEHIEKVLGEIPQEKIEEFTRSPEYMAYRKLFTDLGLE